MCKYQLGSLKTAEALIKDLYIDLRIKVNKWSEITKQTPQARMGYIGQHLVSIVTGFPGGKSGARGYDLILPNNDYGEIKTCYRVDQLGSCIECGAPVSSLETRCARCGSFSIDRKQDSKWLITINNNDEFESILDPKYYYFVLFEFDDIIDEDDEDIIASIWQVDPKCKGFSLCMIDYYLNIRSKSRSKAPFNLWPYMLKFYLMKPELIYRAVIQENNKIVTEVFPSKNNTRKERLPISICSGARNLDVDVLIRASKALGYSFVSHNKSDLLNDLETARVNDNISNDAFCDALADSLYLPLIGPKKDQIPGKLLKITDLEGLTV